MLDLEDSALDIDQVENLIKFCPTKEEMDLLKVGELSKLVILVNLNPNPFVFLLISYQ